MSFSTFFLSYEKFGTAFVTYLADVAHRNKTSGLPRAPKEATKEQYNN